MNYLVVWSVHVHDKIRKWPWIQLNIHMNTPFYFWFVSVMHVDFYANCTAFFDFFYVNRSIKSPFLCHSHVEVESSTKIYRGKKNSIIQSFMLIANYPILSIKVHVGTCRSYLFYMMNALTFFMKVVSIQIFINCIYTCMLCEIARKRISRHTADVCINAIDKEAFVF